LNLYNGNAAIPLTYLDVFETCVRVKRKLYELKVKEKILNNILIMQPATTVYYFTLFIHNKLEHLMVIKEIFLYHINIIQVQKIRHK